MSNTLNQSFGEQLKQFALAVDIANEDTFQKVRSLVNEYTKNTLHITETRFMIESESGESPSLTPYSLASKGVYKSRPIKNFDGEYSGQTAYAYDKNCPLWIVSAEIEKDLRSCNEYVDKWSGAKDLPRYQLSVSEPIKTSIIIPIKNSERRTFGVLNFETTEYLDITGGAQSELQSIAEALALLYATNLYLKEQQEQTEIATAQLKEALNGPLPKLTKPTIFLASSSRAKSDVIKVILNILKEEEFRDKFELVYWKDMNHPGDINDQLLKVLGRCRYGICYLSEQLDSQKHSFQDNPNVVFEAGMLHGRSDLAANIPSSWIPIREEASMTAPFDFSTQRTIIVPRAAKSKRLNSVKLGETVRERLRDLAIVKAG